MDMGMVEECPGPGVKDRDHAYFAAEITGIGCEFCEGATGRFDKDGVENPLMRPKQGAEFRRKGEDEVKVGNREEFLTSFLKPVLLISVLALGAAAILAGMVGITNMGAVIALGDVTAQGLCAALTDIAKRPPMAREHGIAEAVEVLVTVEAKDVCDLGHEPYQRSAMSRSMVSIAVSMPFLVRWV
jgi:hypothetical protein